VTDVPGRVSVFVAPAGTPPTAADAWTHVGYAEDFAIETAACEPVSLLGEPVEEKR
jgi:hypothetical protein